MGEVSQLKTECSQQLAEASAALKHIKAEAAGNRERLCQEHSAELKAAKARHAAELKRLATEREMSQHDELEACTHELLLRSAALEEASCALKQLKEEADAKEEHLRQQHSAELQAASDCHALEVSRLRADYTQQLAQASAALKSVQAEAAAQRDRQCQEHASELESANAEHASEVSRLAAQHLQELQHLDADLVSSRDQARIALEQEQARRVTDIAKLEDQLKNEMSRWADEKSRLEVLHRASMDAQRHDFEARLCAGRQETEARLKAMQDARAAEQAEQKQQLKAQRDEYVKAEAYWRDSKEQAVREALESGETGKRRIAAAFKSARCLAALQEQEVRQAHDDLARRFAARESREEDIRMLREQERRLEENNDLLRARNQQLQGLHSALKNRDVNDKVFGTAAKERRPSPRGPLPPLPGKKVGDLQPFVERRRRSMSACRASSAERNIAVNNVLLEMPISVR